MRFIPSILCLVALCSIEAFSGDVSAQSAVAVAQNANPVLGTYVGTITFQQSQAHYSAEFTVSESSFVVPDANEITGIRSVPTLGARLNITNCSVLIFTRGAFDSSASTVKLFALNSANTAVIFSLLGTLSGNHLTGSAPYNSDIMVIDMVKK